jgi:hypothetical protein
LEVCEVPRGRFALVAGLVGMIVAACMPSSPAAVKPSPSVSIGTAAPVSAPTPSPRQLSPTQPVMPTPTVYARLAIPAGTARCRTSQLEVAFMTGDAAAGNVEDTFEMRNTSATACWVDGYVGFQTLDARGKRMPQTISWSPTTYFGESEPPRRILLPVGTTSLGVEPRTGHAFFNLFTNDVMCNFYENPVGSIQIWPPDEYRPLTIPAKSSKGQQFGFCGGFQLNPLQVQPLPSRTQP